MTVESLLAQLKHPNPHLQARAMQELVELRDESTIPRLMENLGEADVVYRRASVKTLGAIGADAVPPLVEALLNSDDVTVRGSAAKALAQVAVNYPDRPFPPAGIQGLQAALADPNPIVHIAAVMALGEIGEPVLDILVEALQTTDNVALAVAIVNSLGSIGGEEALATLAALSDDDSADDYVREMAVSALSRAEMVDQYRQDAAG